MITEPTHKREMIVQFIRYACVGVMNTLLTLFVIFLCKSILDVNEWLSNGIGYIVGFINSFLWNKHWVFNSHNGMLKEGLKFCIGFILCYMLQLAATWLLTTQTPLCDFQIAIYGFTLSGYGVSTVLGMIVYTMANFVYNRAVTFKG